MNGNEAILKLGISECGEEHIAHHLFNPFLLARVVRIRFGRLTFLPSPARLVGYLFGLRFSWAHRTSGMRQLDTQSLNVS
jgi:hypothetical protein